MKMQFAVLSACVTLASACAHDDAVVVEPQFIADPGAPAYSDRITVAAETCEARYEPNRQNYLAAVEARIGDVGAPDATRAPLDAFRAEINAAYNTVVMRCKTHMNCLEYNRYNEAACYMAASDRKDAERLFADLAQDLRRIDRRKSAPRAAGGDQRKNAPPVTVTNTYSPSNSQTQSQTQNNDAQTGSRIEDQDVLVLCADAKNLLTARCRQACGQGCKE